MASDKKDFFFNIGFSGYDSEKNFLLNIDPLKKVINLRKMGIPPPPPPSNLKNFPYFYKKKFQWTCPLGGQLILLYVCVVYLCLARLLGKLLIFANRQTLLENSYLCGLNIFTYIKFPIFIYHIQKKNSAKKGYISINGGGTFVHGLFNGLGPSQSLSVYKCS